MAKRIYTESPEQPPVENTDVEKTADMEQKAESPKEQAEQDAENMEPVKGNEPVPIGEEIRRLLALFPAYERLYIDKQGGTYAPDTPPNIRAEALLYENPYYKNTQTD